MASLAPWSKRDLAAIAIQTEGDPIFEQMACHSAAVSRKARPVTVAQWDMVTAKVWDEDQPAGEPEPDSRLCQDSRPATVQIPTSTSRMGRV